jgi:hypothetical protein
LQSLFLRNALAYARELLEAEDAQEWIAAHRSPLDFLALDCSRSSKEGEAGSHFSTGERPTLCTLRELVI